MKEKDIIVELDPQDWWEKNGYNKLTFTGVICELIDNSVSNFLNNSGKADKEIKIYITHSKSDKIDVVIEDNGSGMKNLQDSFRAGRKTGVNYKADSIFNEHGLGLKNALAKANPQNDDWKIFTKSNENENIFTVINSPYMVNHKLNYETTTNLNKWPTDNRYKTGTAINFSCSFGLFKTINKRRRDSFHNFIKDLREELGVIYRPFMQKDNIDIAVYRKGLEETRFDKIKVKPISPDNEELIKAEGKTKSLINPGEFLVPTDNGNVKVEYKFCKISVHDEKSRREKFKYYRCNKTSSGAEIRLSGKLLEYNVMEEIWPKMKNNRDENNSFWGEINISGPRDALPITAKDKTGFIPEDPTYQEILNNIQRRFNHTNIPKYKPKKSNVPKEIDYQNNFIENVKKQFDAENYNIESPYDLFSDIDTDRGAIAELDVLIVNNKDGKVTLIENKAKTSKLLDFYQLKMYWDGYVFDKDVSPDEGILVAKNHPNWANQIVEYINKSKDAKGNQYNFKTRKWDDYFSSK